MTASTFSRRRLEARRAEVDHLVGPEIADAVEVAAPAVAITRGAGLPGELHRVSADVAGGTVDQHPLARSDAGVLEQHLPGGDRDHRHGGGVDMVQGRGLRRDPPRLGQSVLGIGASEAAVGDPIDLVAGPEPATPGPTASTTPDRSEPRVSGSGCGRTLLPALIQPSQGPTPAAATRTSTSPSPGAGTRQALDSDGLGRAEPVDAGGAHRGGSGGWGRGLVRHSGCSLVGRWSRGRAGLPRSGRTSGSAPFWFHPDREQARGFGRARVLGEAVQRPRRLHPALPRHGNPQPGRRRAASGWCRRARRRRRSRGAGGGRKPAGC